jgi:peptidoglycan-associated lipoprotein
MEVGMTTNRLIRLAACAATALLLAACASTPLEETSTAPVTDKSVTPGTKPGDTKADPRAVARVDTTPSAVDPLKDPASPLSKRSIYFDFDSFVVKPEFQGTVEAHGKFLVGNPSRRLVIEGNADERGSREYNLALGQKRAEAVKSRLRLLGVAESQMETVSFGEEKPVALGSDEASWAQNRRADLNYK